MVPWLCTGVDRPRSPACAASSNGKPQPVPTPCWSCAPACSAAHAGRVEACAAPLPESTVCNRVTLVALVSLLSTLLCVPLATAATLAAQSSADVQIQAGIADLVRISSLDDIRLNQFDGSNDLSAFEIKNFFSVFLGRFMTKYITSILILLLSPLLYVHSKKVHFTATDETRQSLETGTFIYLIVCSNLVKDKYLAL